MTRYITAVITLIMLALPVRAVSAVDYLQGDARLDIGFDESGAKRASIGFKVKIGDVEAFTIGFAEWFGVDPSEVKVETDIEGLTLVAGARSQLAGSPPLIYSDTLDTSALQRALQAAGAETLHVVAFLPPSPIAKIGELQGINLMGVLRHEVVVPVESLKGTWAVTFGWRYRDLAIYIATPALFLVLFEFALRRLRHRALATQGPDQPAAIFVCGRVHHFAALLFLVVWPGMILMIVPMGYLLYLPQGYETLGLALIVFVPLLAAMAYTIWIRAALYPVFQQFPEPNWSRRELIAQGCVISSLCLFHLVFFGGSVLMLAFDRFDNIETHVFALLPIVAAFIPILAIVMYSRFLGTVVRSPEARSEIKRYEELAEWVGLKNAPLLVLVYRLRSRLAAAIESFISMNAMRMKRQSAVYVEARLLRRATPDELDVLLMTELDKVKETRWKFVTFVRTAYTGLAYPGLFLAAMGALILIREGDAIKYFFNGWVIFSAIYLLPSAILLAGRRHEMKLVRRYTRMTDERVLEQLGDPEAQIRALLRQARVNCVPLETSRWIRALTVPSPMERIRHLAERRGISEDRIAALREHIDAPTDQAATDIDINIVAVFDRLLIRINLFRTLPIFGYLGLPILVAWANHRVLNGAIPLWVLLLLAAPICAFIVMGGQNTAWRLGKRRIVAALQDQIPIEASTDIETVPVRFSRVLHLGEMQAGSVDSAGLLLHTGDALCYRNDDTNLTMYAAEIEKISVALEPGSFFPIIVLRVDWREKGTGNAKEYRIQVLRPGTAHGGNLDTLGLYARIALWWRDERDKNSGVREEVETCRAERITFPWSVVNVAKCIGKTLGVGIFCATLSFYAGWKDDLPINWTDSNSALVVPAIFAGVTALIAIFQGIYLRRVARELDAGQEWDPPLTHGG